MKMLTTQSHDQVVRVKKILQEDAERFEQFLGLLEKWMDGHAFLPKNYDKRMLPIFLRNCKYNLDKTKRKLELYFVHKKRYPEAFGFYEFTAAEKRGMENFYVFDASKLTPDGCRVLCMGFRSPDTTGCDMNAVNKIIAMSSTYKANLDVVNSGLIVVYNLQNLSPSIVAGVINPLYKHNLDMLQKIYPFRIGGIYVTFLPGFAVPIANMIKLIFSRKIKSRIHMEEGNEYMKKKIPAYCLPEEFGGTDGTINERAAKFIQEIVQAKHWFLKQEKVQMQGDIPKDLYEASGIDENFGTHGSFRKLNID